MASRSLPHHHTRKRIQYPWEVCVLATSTPTILKHSTLRVLKSCGIPSSKITVFVQGKDEQETFQHQLSQGTYGRIVASPTVGVSGLLHCIYSAYKVGTPLVVCRDSIEAIHHISVPIKSLIPLFQSMFPLCTTEKVGLWGVHPSHRAFCLKDSVSRGVKQISGGMWGVHTPGPAPEFSVTMETIPEFQSVCQFSKVYGNGILRLNSVSVTWRPCPRSKQRDAELERLAEIYPEFVVLQQGDNPGLDIRFIQDKGN
jgi:hypothetical protein